MIAAAIVCAAVASQAMQANWGVNSAASTDLNTKVYLLAASDILDSYTSVADFTGRALDEGPVAKVGSSYKVKSRLADNDKILKSGDYYLAVISSDEKSVKYIKADGFTDFVYDSAAQESGKGTYLAVTFTDITGSSTSATIGAAVPEPTSAMLLLLGVAGLALKRKRA